jgi:DNA polymerase gamma 1
VVPLVPNWKEWLARVENVFHEHNEEMTKICVELVWKTYEDWKIQYLHDPKAADAWILKDPWISQLDWEVKAVKGKYAHIPNWVRPFVKDPDTKVGTKSQLAHLLLKLQYEESPITMTKDNGWCYHNEDGELTKIPHPKGNGDNVGGVLSKDFVEDMACGRLKSELPEAKRALDIANATSYWTSVRKRVMDRIFMTVSNPYGKDAIVTLPEILAHGTVTRRTVEPLMVTMCSTKNWRIGTELKTRVEAPEGWKIVGADFDGQEMQIAAAYCDAWDTGIVGGSPMGFNVLSGSKDNGTDPHSALAKNVGVDRDTAKIAGFAMLYGAGARAITTYIRRKYPEKPDREVRDLANKMLKTKKGFRDSRQDPYRFGSDSGCYNYMERIAMKTKVPQLPCLGTKISTALRPAVVGDDFATGRNNWTIQASGSEILATILTATHWLMDEFKIPGRFILSIHDEVWWMVPDKYAELFAVLYQMAHVYTWARFQASVNLPDLPLSRAFFSSVAIDNRIRKSPHEKTVTPSNPKGIHDPEGTEFSMRELSENGAVDKLKTRYSLIQRGLL